MKKLKKCLVVLIVLFSAFVITGCQSKNIEGSLEKIMERIYSDIPENKRPIMLQNIELTEENIEGFIGTTDIKYENALASEPGIGSIAHSVVLIRANSEKDVSGIKQKIKDNVNPRKWVCVGVEEEDVIIKSKGDLVILILIDDEQTREKIEKGFDNL